MKTNYQLILDDELKRIGSSRPKLLLHSCCGPCSSYVLEYLNKYFDITILYYNPNIYPAEEFFFRAEEQKRLIEQMKLNCGFIEDKFDDTEFYNAVKGYESVREGGERCFRCYELRLRRTAVVAASESFDYFTTTLSISPHKNAQKLNEIGKKLSEEYGINYLYSDFKKKNGYKRSCELSEQYGIYRQNYCGCIFSKREREEMN